MISKAVLKTEIDQLDSAYLELAYNILRQIPHRAPSFDAKSSASDEQDPILHSQPIQYQVNNVDLQDVTPFAEVDDAGAYVRDLRQGLCNLTPTPDY